MNREEYLRDRLDDQIEWYDRKSSQNQTWFKRLQLISVSAAVLVPFVTGYITTSGGFLKFVAGALGVIAAVSSAVLGLYKFHENWIEYRTTCETLRHEKFLFLTGTAPYESEDAFAVLVERVEGLISRENSNWSIAMAKDKSGE